MNRITKITGLIIGSLLLVVITKTILNKPVLENQNISLAALPTDAIKHMTEAIQIATETPNDAFEYDSAVFYS